MTPTVEQKLSKERLIQICEEIATDAENDAKEFDGKPFDGRTVAAYFGYHGAAIAALSNVVKQIIENSNLAIDAKTLK